MHIRKAEITDLKALLDIYNYEVEHGTATFDTEPRTMAQREEWFYEHNVENHPHNTHNILDFFHFYVLKCIRFEQTVNDTCSAHGT